MSRAIRFSAVVAGAVVVAFSSHVVMPSGHGHGYAHSSGTSLAGGTPWGPPSLSTSPAAATAGVSSGIGA
jgi:hypothetical protein